MKKILLICLALVLALGSLGVAGALWSDWLYIDGYVETGYIGAEWSIEATYDDEAADKDVSWILADLFYGPDWMYIDIYNAYPSVTYTVEWNIVCTGSVPIHFDTPWIGGDLPAGATLTFTDMAGVPINWYGYQLHPGETMYGMLTIHLDNDALQNTSYWFYIELQYGQYNEFP
ncbi:MAG: hypothetical protein WBE46_08245 [Dehalococcoidia bacterium]